MSGLEILGAAAAASQFIVYGTKVIDFLIKVREAPNAIEKQIIHIRQLVEVSKLVEQSPHLNSGTSGSSLQKILKPCEIEIKYLDNILVEKFPGKQHSIKATWKSLLAVSKEKEIIAAFTTLERLKSSLILCISTTDSSSLSSIGIGVAQVRMGAAKTNTAIGDLSKETRQMRTSLDRVSTAIIDRVSGVTTVLEEVHSLREATTELQRLISPIATRLETVENSVPGLNESDHDAKKLVRNWLKSEASGEWLVIVDNADDPEVLLQRVGSAIGAGSSCLLDYLPQNAQGSILLTTRTRKAGIKFATTRNIVDLAGMDFEEAQELLQMRLNDYATEKEKTREFLETLEYLPLAITQATAYMAENSISLTEYLDMYEESEMAKIELLSHDFEELRRVSESKNPIATTWLISFEHIKQGDLYAADLLSYMVCLDRLGIPQALLPVPPSTFKRTNALGLLQGYSMVRKTQNGLFDIHRLVYLATRNWLKQRETFIHWVRESIRVVSEAFPKANKHGDRQNCEVFISHARTVLSYEEMFIPISVMNRNSAWLTAISRYHNGNRSTVSSETTQKSSVSLGLEENYFDDFKTSLPVDHDKVYRLIAVLASRVGYYYCNDKYAYNVAEELLCQGVRAIEAVLGTWHIQTLKLVRGFSFNLREIGKLEVSEWIFREHIKAKEAILGRNDQSTIESVLEPAIGLERRGKLEEAEPLLLEVLNFRENNTGLDDILTLEAMKELAKLFRQQAKYQESERLYRQILDLYTKARGHEYHPLLPINILHDLGRAIRRARIVQRTGGDI
ncbi:kinesin light chain [Phlyctema vagabunda]|uniref:Kinesin light chain n=1 Tax=Phlyctema vagabunda TaxID=108571 RepID=A0ABR4PR95_9HELO